MFNLGCNQSITQVRTEKTGPTRHENTFAFVHLIYPDTGSMAGKGVIVATTGPDCRCPETGGLKQGT